VTIRSAASLRGVLAIAAAVAALGVVALVATGNGAAQGSASAVNVAGVVTVTTDLAYEGSQAAGTGMVLTRAGQVLTNNHVIKGATSIRVTLPASGKSYSAKVLGYSVGGDIALLQLENASGLGTVTTGDSSRVRIGESVTAVGNAGGRGTTTSSTGKVTALNRSITVSDGGRSTARLSNLIEIDAELEPGDSGGPLLDSLDHVVGMNSAASLGFRFEASNDGYSIPINRALAVVGQVRSGSGSVTVHVGSTPLLGVSISPAFGGDNPGALVADVAPGLPADKAGIVAGSTITRLDGKAVGSYAQLTTLLLRHHAGDTVTVRWADPSGAFHTARVKTVSGPPQ
jgi:S1-C subfamily serine protease